MIFVRRKKSGAIPYTELEFTTFKETFNRINFVTHNKYGDKILILTRSPTALVVTVKPSYFLVTIPRQKNRMIVKYGRHLTNNQLTKLYEAFSK